MHVFVGGDEQQARGILACMGEWCALVDPALALVQLAPWRARLAALAQASLDPHESEAIAAAQRRVRLAADDQR